MDTERDGKGKDFGTGNPGSRGVKQQIHAHTQSCLEPEVRQGGGEVRIMACERARSILSI